MGLIRNIFGALFGRGRNVIKETAEVFRENTEAGAQRQADYAKSALAQYSAEFQIERKGLFDRLMDSLNRFPRPLMVISTFSLFASAMFDPIWFAERMQGLSLVPEPLWWLAGTIVAFYFGGRFQLKSQEFHQSIQNTTARVPEVLGNIERLWSLRHDSPGVADTGTDAELTIKATDQVSTDNEAVRAWQEAK